MTYKTIPIHTVSPVTLPADELAEGDIIKHAGTQWQVLDDPRYTRRGIEFTVLWLDVTHKCNTQQVCFHPAWRFELVATAK